MFKKIPSFKHEYLYKKLNSSDVTAEIAESRLSFLIKKNRIENKLTNEKRSYFIKDQTFLNGPIQSNISDHLFPLNCETSSVVKIIYRKIDIQKYKHLTIRQVSLPKGKNPCLTQK